MLSPAAAQLPPAVPAGPGAVVVLLQFVQTIAGLFLPSLNANIIDKGIAAGNTGYILSTGASCSR